MNVLRAAQIVYGNEPTNATNLYEARSVIAASVRQGYRFNTRGTMLATPTCADYEAALTLRNKAADLLNAADYHEENGDDGIAKDLRTQANAIYDDIPPVYMDRTE